MTQPTPSMPLAPEPRDFDEARAVIRDLVHRTPLLSFRSLGQRAGVQLWLKAENLQKTGSFKARGAANKVLHLTGEERGRGVISASAGNHGQALAYVAQHVGIPGYIVMPEKANPSKVAAVRGYGAEAILHGRLWDDAYARSCELAAEKNLTYVHPFKDRFIMAGQGTIALEILEDVPDVDAVLVPIGGGGLICGIATALKQRNPGTRVIGIEAEGSANMTVSRAAGKPTDLESVDTIADGLATQRTDPEVFAIVERHVDELVTVSDREILHGISFLLERGKLLAEEAGATAVAALLSGKVKLPADAKTVAMVCGGNLDVSSKLRL